MWARTLLHYLRPWASRLGLAMLSLGVYNLFSVVSLALLIPFLEILFSENTLQASAPSLGTLGWDPALWRQWGYAWLGQQMQSAGKIPTLLMFCGVVVGAVTLKNLFRYLSHYLIAPVEMGVVQHLRNEVYDRLARLPLRFFVRQRKGKLLNLVGQDVQWVQEGVAGSLQNLLSDPLTMLFFLGAMLAISWQLTLFTLIVLPVCGLAIARISRSLKKRAVRSQDTMDRLLSILDEFSGGIRVIKSFGAEGFVRQQWQATNASYAAEQVGFRRRFDLASPLTEVLSILVVVALLYYGGSLILQGKGNLKGSEFIGFMALFSQFLTPIKTLTTALSRVQRARVAYGRLRELLDGKEIEPEGQQPAAPLQQAIVLKDVSFGYDDAQVLQHIDLTIGRGQTVALVGHSGAGKSTLVDLLCRFYDPSAGSIHYDGADMRQLSPASLRQQMGIVGQEPTLFHDTIAANIAFGRAATEAQIIEAAQAAQAHSFIQQLPDGYATLVGERGSALSAGQRQRVAIARALLGSPPILILDEATSALDAENERLIQEAIDKLRTGHTVIVIAHRLSTIRRADLIVVLHEGRIAEQGTHDALLAQQGIYHKLWELQAGG